MLTKTKKADLDGDVKEIVLGAGEIISRNEQWATTSHAISRLITEKLADIDQTVDYTEVGASFNDIYDNIPHPPGLAASEKADNASFGSKILRTFIPAFSNVDRGLAPFCLRLIVIAQMWGVAHGLVFDRNKSNIAEQFVGILTAGHPMEPVQAEAFRLIN